MYLDKIKKQLLERKLASSDELLGRTQDEVITLERQLSISLPKAYQEFPLLMGHGAGKFLRGSDCFFAHLPYLQDWAVKLLKENNFSASLPEDGFVFLMHQGYQFSFFRLSAGLPGLLCDFIQESFGLLEVGRVEPLGEPAVDRGQ